MSWILETDDTSSGKLLWKVDLRMVLQEIRENVMKKRIALLKQAQKTGVNPDSKVIYTEEIVVD